MFSLCRSTRRPLLNISLVSRSIFINTETTPNPNSIKFIPGIDVLPAQHGTGLAFEISNRKDIQRSPLAIDLFKIEGVTGVYLGKDFVTVTKNSQSQWQQIKPQVFSSIFDFFSQERDIITDVPLQSDTAILETDDEVVATIKELIETKIRPYVQEDGGDIYFVKYDAEGGLVHVRLAGSCVGCPSSSVTLRNGVENMLMHYIPEVKGIVDATTTTPSEEEVRSVSEGEGAQDRKLSYAPQS